MLPGKFKSPDLYGNLQMGDAVLGPLQGKNG